MAKKNKWHYSTPGVNFAIANELLSCVQLVNERASNPIDSPEQFKILVRAFFPDAKFDTGITIFSDEGCGHIIVLAHITPQVSLRYCIGFTRVIIKYVDPQIVLGSDTGLTVCLRRLHKLTQLTPDMVYEQYIEADTQPWNHPFR